MLYTYLHRRLDTNEVFYVGKGQRRRAWEMRRSNWWKSLVAKAGGRTVEILAHWPTEAEAFEHEKFLIACFRDLGAPLCNMTDGGEGCSGSKRGPITDATRVRLSESHTGKTHSGETKSRMSRSRTGHRVSLATREKLRAANSGQQMTPEQRAKLSAAHKGKRISEDHRRALSAALKNHQKTPDHVAAARDGVLRYHEGRRKHHGSST